MQSTSVVSSVDGEQSHIVIERKAPTEKVTATTAYRLLKFADARFRIADSKIITSSDYIRKLVAAGKCPVVIDLDHLKRRQPCLTSDGIATAIQYANGRAVIALNKIVESLAASNALQMWEMRNAINKQLAKLASIPHSAPFAISIAAINVTSDWRNIIFEHACQVLEDVVIQPAFAALSFLSLKTFINFIIEKMMEEVGDEHKKDIAKSMMRGLSTWLDGKPERESELRDIFHKIELYLGKSQTSDLETAEENDESAYPRGVSVMTTIPKITYTLDKEDGEKVEENWCEHDLPSNRQSAGGSQTLLKPNYKTYVFRGVELPPVEADENGVRNYTFVVRQLFSSFNVLKQLNKWIDPPSRYRYFQMLSMF